MWKDEIIVWEDSPNFKWNDLGEITDIPDSYDDELYAQGVVVWRKISLGDFVERAVSFYEAGKSYLEDRNILNGFMLVVSVFSFIPLHFEIIKDDEVANKFLSLVKREESKHYILKEDFENSEFSKKDSLNLFITDLLKDDVLIETNDKYFINGKILTSVHLWDSDDD